MEPEKPNNYWKNDSDSDEPTEMYAPQPMDDDPQQAEANIQEAPPQQPASPTTEEPVRWSANEYIDNKKGGLWFIGFAIIVIALIVGDILLFKEYTFSILVIVMAAALIILSRRPAKIIDYTLSGDQGLYIGERLYHFSEFKAFGVISEDGHHSIMLIPIKRFAIALSVYFPEELGEKIVDIFGARLPMHDLKLDAIDVIVRKLRL
jgi:hypothetical protein